MANVIKKNKNSIEVGSVISFIGVTIVSVGPDATGVAVEGIVVVDVVVVVTAEVPI